MVDCWLERVRAGLSDVDGGKVGDGSCSSRCTVSYREDTSQRSRSIVEVALQRI